MACVLMKGEVKAQTPPSVPKTPAPTVRPTPRVTLDKIPPSFTVYGLKMTGGQTYGTDRQGRLLVALTPRTVPAQAAPPRAPLLPKP